VATNKPSAQVVKAAVKESVGKLAINEANKYTTSTADGGSMVLKSLFDHSEAEVRDRMALVKRQVELTQDALLKREFDSLKIVPS
jgi:hypothetical protein